MARRDPLLVVVARLRSRGPIILALALVAGLLGLLGAFAIAPSTYKATVELRVKLNLGGIGTNSSADASVDSVALVQSNMLHATRSTLHGAALLDPSALYRTTCNRDPSDTIAVCSTTSGNRRAGIAVLNQLMQTFIPISLQTQIGSFRAFLRDMAGQYNNLGGADRRLSQEIAQARQGSRRGRRTVLPERRAQLVSNLDVRRQILVREASVRKQILAVSQTLRVVGRGATAIQESRLMSLAFGAACGLLVGLIASVLLPLGRREEAAIASRDRRGSLGLRRNRKSRPTTNV